MDVHIAQLLLGSFAASTQGIVVHSTLVVALLVHRAAGLEELGKRHCFDFCVSGTAYPFAIVSG